MTANTAWLLTIKIREGAAGMFFATSEDEPTFFVSAKSADALYKAIPAALKSLFQERDHVEAAVFPTNRGTFAVKKWAVVPKALMAARAAEQMVHA